MTHQLLSCHNLLLYNSLLYSRQVIKSQCNIHIHKHKHQYISTTLSTYNSLLYITTQHLSTQSKRRPRRSTSRITYSLKKMTEQTPQSTQLNGQHKTNNDLLQLRRLESDERQKLTAAIAKRIVQPELARTDSLNSTTTDTDSISTNNEPVRHKLTRRIRKQWEIAISKILGIGYASEGNYVEIYADGNNAFEQMFNAIDQAKTRILFETFIWRPDNIGLLMIDKLAAAARRGCEVVVLYDGAGSLALKDDKHLAPLLAEENATVTVFNSLFQWPWSKKSGHSLWFRTHRKILVCDDTVGFAGGMNCTAQYAGTDIGGINTFRDTHMKIVGPAVEHLSTVFVDSLSEATSRLQWERRFDAWKQRASTTRTYLSHPYNQLYSLLQRSKKAYTDVREQGINVKLQSIITRILGDNTPASNIAQSTVKRVQSVVTGSRNQFNNVRNNIASRPSMRRATNISTNVRNRLQSISRRARSQVRRSTNAAKSRLLPHETRRNTIDMTKATEQRKKTQQNNKPQEDTPFQPIHNITHEYGTDLKIDRGAAEQRELKQQSTATAEHLPHHIIHAERARRRSSETTPEEQAELGIQRAESRTDKYSVSDSTSDTTKQRSDSVSSDQSETELPGDVFVQVLQSNVVRNTMHIQRVMHTTIDNAVNEILITNPFFIPPSKLANAISRAARRGVKIRIITCGKSDTPYMRWAATHIYHKFLSLGIEIYEYNERILHAKTVTIDGIYSSVGSFNMDMLSGWKLLELNIAMISQDVSKQLQEQFYIDKQYTQRITLNTLNDRSIFEKLLHWACYRFSRFVSAWLKTY